MTKLYVQFATLSWRRQDGQTMVEYGVLLALLVLVCVAAVAILGGKLSALWQNIADQLPGG